MAGCSDSRFEQSRPPQPCCAETRRDRADACPPLRHTHTATNPDRYAARHGVRPASRVLYKQKLESQKSPDRIHNLRIGPVFRADILLYDFAFPVNHISLRPLESAVVAADILVRISRSCERQLVPLHKPLISRLILIDADTKHDHA